jgi:hypothetical protein
VIRGGIPYDVSWRERQHMVRNEHILSYGVSPLFIKGSDRFSHGLNERIAVGDVRPSIDYMLSLF